MSNRLEDFFPGKARQKVKFVFSTLVVKPLVVPALIYLHHLLRKVFISRAFEQLNKKVHKSSPPGFFVNISH